MSFGKEKTCPYIADPEYGLIDAFCNHDLTYIVVSNTNQDNFRQILRQNVYGEPEILYLSAKKFGRISIHGNILTSDAAASEIRKFIYE